MSFKAIRWAMGQKAGDIVSKAVLIKLADCMSEDGRCFPSQAVIMTAIEAGNRHTVIKALDRLEERGLITRRSVVVPKSEKNHGGKITYYTLVGYEGTDSATSDTLCHKWHIVPQVTHSATFDPTHGATSGTLTYNNILTYNSISTQETHSATSGTTSDTTEKEEKVEAPSASPQKKTQALKPEGLTDDEWRDLIAEQKAKRQVLTETRLKAWEREGAKCGFSLAEVCLMVSENGWQGFDANKHKRYSQGYTQNVRAVGDDPFNATKRKEQSATSSSKEKAIEAYLQGSLL